MPPLTFIRKWYKTLYALPQDFKDALDRQDVVRRKQAFVDNFLDYRHPCTPDEWATIEEMMPNDIHYVLIEPLVYQVAKLVDYTTDDVKSLGVYINGIRIKDPYAEVDLKNGFATICKNSVRLGIKLIVFTDLEDRVDRTVIFAPPAE